MKRPNGPAEFDKWQERTGANYFVYPYNNPNTERLVSSGKYGVVQLVCIDNVVRDAFMAGYRAGRRYAASPGASHGE